MKLAEIFEWIVGRDAGIEFTAYDGSRSGPPDADLQIEVRTPLALHYLAQAPGELGLARAYVAGHLELHGGMYETLARMSDLALEDMPWSQKLEIVRGVGWKPLVYRVAPPPQEMRRGRLLARGLWRHAKGRDAEAIQHHYDVSNRFYEWVLGPSMAYTCAVFPAADATLEEAQWAKHDLVARKLGLQPGMRLLDVGCGWGGMVMHAAKEYGVRALGVTLSKQQAEWAQKAIAERGLSDLAEVRHLDYRDVAETGFDRVSSIGLTEHIGKQNVPGYFRFLYGRLRPGGRLLNHCITRPDNDEPAIRTGGFINRYVFPDGELESPGFLVNTMNDAGFEIRHEENLREHYALTLREWCRNLEDHWDEAVAEVGKGRARVWRLYMAGSRLGFERNKIQLHQVLGAKLGSGGESGMSLRPDFG